MRLREQRMWDRLRNGGAATLWMERIENMVGDGTPDLLVMRRGLKKIFPVELKSVESFPKRCTTRVLGQRGLRLSQRNWLKEFTEANGKAFILVEVGNTWYVFGGGDYDRVNDFSKADFEKFALLIFSGSHRARSFSDFIREASL